MTNFLDAPRADAVAPVTDDGRGYYSISQAAALLGVSRVSIWRWIRDGRLPAARLGHRTTRIKRDDLERLMVRLGPADSPSRTARDRDATSDDAAAPEPDPGRVWGGLGPSEHVVQFYESDAFLMDSMADFIGTALRTGDSGIVVATQAHRAGIEERLRADGIALDAARDRGRYVALDAAETLAEFMVDGEPEPELFTEVLASIIAQAAEDGARVRIFGEMVALLASEGNQAAAVRLEEIWNELQQTLQFSLACAYPLDSVGGKALGDALDQVCAAHTRVVPAESYTALPTPDDRDRAIAVLQQKARWLEAEIAERTRVASALESLFRVSQKLHASLDLESLLDHLIVEALQLVGAEGGCGGLRTPDGMVCQKYFRTTEAVPLEYRWSPGHGLPGWLLLHKVPYVTNDALHDEQIVRELCDQFGVRSALCMPILDAHGEVLGFFELHNKTDGAGFTRADQEKLMAVSQAASVAIQNARLYREAQDAVRLRDEFLSIASHELRTPLTTVGAHAQLMLRRLARDGSVEPATVERAFRAVSEQSGKLARLVDQLLDVSRLSAGKLTLERQTLDLRALVERVVAAAAVRTAQPIVVHAPEAIVAMVDPLRLDQALTNLLDNAIKYGAEDQQIDVELIRAADAHVELAVRDRGPGIPEEKRDGIFERFFQAHADGYKSGMGLGLYISRQVADLHGGEIRAEFPSSGGTRFVVRLPIELAEPATPHTNGRTLDGVSVVEAAAPTIIAS